MNDVRYSVKAASNLAGVTAHTLRAWETRYGAFKPRRAPSGHRYYSDEDIERLKLIASLTRRGHSISSIARYSRAKLLTLVRQNSNTPERMGGDQKLRGQPLYRERFEMLRANLRKLEFRELALNLEWLKTALGCREYVLDVVVPFLQEVGEQVEKKQIDIAQEHILSVLLREKLVDLLNSLQASSSQNFGSKRPVLFATPEGDLHEFGVLLGAILCALHTIPCHFLGANLPAVNLARMAKNLKSGLLVLGNAPVPYHERRISFADYLGQLDRGLPGDIEIWSGGSGERPSELLPSGKKVVYLNSLSELDSRLFKMAGIRNLAAEIRP